MDIRYKIARKVSIVNASTNTLLAIIKIIAGVLGSSHALIADGIHSFSDLISDALVLIAAKMGGRNPDKRHPYGHQRIETIAAIIIALLLIAVGVGIIYDTAIHFLQQTTNTVKGVPVILVAVISILTNEWLYRYTHKAGKLINSNLLLTNAWHNRSDALVSVIVLFSVIGTLLGIHYLDAIGAIIIAILILKIGIKMIWTSISELIDAGVDDGTLKNIRHTILSIPGIVSIHQLRTRMHGGAIFVDVHIIVEPMISVSEGHYIGDQVLHALTQSNSSISDITVHIDPENDEVTLPSLNLPNRDELQAKLNHHWKALPGFDMIEKLVLHYLDGKIQVEIFMSANILDQHKSDALYTIYQESIKPLNEIYKININFSVDSATQ